MLENPRVWKDNCANEMRDYAIGSNADFVLCDESGYVVLCTGTELEEIDSSSLREFDGENGGYVYGTLNGVLSETSHIMGISFKANGPRYYMFAYTGKSVQDSYTWNIMQIFIVSAIIVLIVVMFLVYFATLRLTAPVTEIAEVSKKLGEGDFSVTLPDYSTKEFQQLSTAFNDMAANLKSYDTMRNSFLANVSHELRTPMTSIGGFVDGLMDGTIPKSEEKRYLRIISSEVHRLTRLIKSMLNLAKIEAGEMEPSCTSFSALEPIVDTLVTFESKLDAKHVEVRGLDVDRVEIYADIDLVHQVMYNLIENAIKFVNNRGYIEFSFKPEGHKTVISIKNSGEGLSEEQLPLVFDRFYKVDKSRGLDAKGLGLGLNIVRSIVELHGGKIMVRSVRGEYTEFMFTLPNRPEED
jgi:signal transduction histidine kinase